MANEEDREGEERGRREKSLFSDRSLSLYQMDLPLIVVAISSGNVPRRKERRLFNTSLR